MQIIKSRFPDRRLLAGFVVLTALTMSGCAMLSRTHHHRSSSVVAFLFPEEQPMIPDPGLPVLHLPLRVGLAFVPDTGAGQEPFSQSQKHLLLERVAAEFRQLPFVQSIQNVPELYLRRGGGFQNLDQVRALLGIDVVVLLSYDQAQFSEGNKRSLAYWTIIGAYFVNGNQNDTHTLMEATVYDIASRTLLFHAPGVDVTRASSSLVLAEKELRQDSTASLQRATEGLVQHLQTELDEFSVAVKEGRSKVTIAHRPGYSGGGAMGGVAVIGAVMLVLVAMRGGSRDRVDANRTTP